ncbi:phage virion morphogenesis family protein [Janthinobacterium sp. HH104]|nr:phage virion morphogenesis family protein [Janthinobacterium sp. HH104]
MAIDLRRGQAQRIKAQQGPDGAAYPARKRRKEFKGKKGRIKRQKAAMFAKIRTVKHLKVKATGDQIEVGFFGWVARVAHVHQFGRQDRLSKKGPLYKYPERPLMGVSEPDRTLIRESLLRHMEKN